MQLKTHLHPKTGARVPLLPFSIPHGPTFEPDVRWKPDVKTVPWWQDEKYNVGLETARPVNVRITNSLIKRSATIKVRRRKWKLFENNFTIKNDFFTNYAYLYFGVHKNDFGRMLLAKMKFLCTYENRSREVLEKNNCKSYIHRTGTVYDAYQVSRNRIFTEPYSLHVLHRPI